MDTLRETPLQLPQRLNLSIPSVMRGSSSYSVNISPESTTSITGPAVGAILGAINEGRDYSAFVQQGIKFNIPCGESQSICLDPQSTTLSFKMTYTVTTAVDCANCAFALISSASSWFDRLSLTSSNLPMEEINYYSLVAHMMSQMTMSKSDRYGAWVMGTDSASGSSGIDLPFEAGTYNFHFCIPLLSSVIGLNNEKLLPVGLIQNLVLEMTTCARYPLSCYSGATVTAAGAIAAGITLSDFKLNLRYIDLGQETAKLFLSTLGSDQTFYIKSSTYAHNSYTIPASSSGSVQIPIQIRNASVKSIWNLFSIPVELGVACPNGMFDSINPGLTSRQLVCGSKNFPSEVINDTKYPALGYYYTLQSFGRDLSISNACGVNRYNYCALYSAVTGQDASYSLPAAGLRPQKAGVDATENVITRYPNSFITGFNLETLNGTLFSGINTRSINPQLNLYLSANTPVPKNITVNSFALLDCIIVIDVATRSIRTVV